MSIVIRKTAKKHYVASRKQAREIVIGNVKVVLRRHPNKGTIRVRRLKEAVAATIASR